MPYPSRRQFLEIASVAASCALLPAPLRAVAIATRSEDGAPMPARRLDEGWEFRRGPTAGIWEAWRPEEKGLWHPVALPHCVNALDACDPDTPYFRGQGWYRTHLAATNSMPGGRTILHFQGAGQTTTLWVGSTLVGTHKGGYDEFVFDITDAVAVLTAAETKSGIPVVILCDNSPDLERVPSDLSDFCLYGGLYRHVHLVSLPPVALDSIHIHPVIAPDGSTNVSIEAQLYNPTASAAVCAVSIEVLGPDDAVVHRASQTIDNWTDYRELANFTIPRPQLWSPDTPHLYRCNVTVQTGGSQTALTERFGLRTTEFVPHGPFKLNGQRLLLRGTHRHVDHAGLAAAMPDALVRQEMQLIKDMGANFIRLAHYQQDRLVLELCDELGLMVWEEVPWCRAGVGDHAFQQNAKDMLRHMIGQHFNHPSIILWGLGNEDDWPNEFPSVDQTAIRAFLTEMRDLVHSLDSSRLTSFRRCDFARDIPDVYSPSIWAGWYSGNYHEYEESLLKQRDRVNRFLHIEWGADSLAGRHSEDPDAILHRVPTGVGTDERGLAYLKAGGPIRVSSDGDWSETYACRLFDWHLKTQEKLDWLTGAAQWIFKDFASPLRDDSAIPRINQKGVVQRDLTLKESYFVFQSYWASKPMAHIYGHTWPIRWGKPGEQRPVEVYSNCDHAELFLNGKSLGMKSRDSQDFPAAGLRWQAPFVPGENHLRVVATRGAATVTDQITLTYQTEPWGKPAQLRLAQLNHTANTVTIAATLHDAAGLRCLDAHNVVRFSLAGAGSLIDNLGTAAGSREIQLANGCAQISIQRKGGCTLGITSEGLPATLFQLP